MPGDMGLNMNGLNTSVYGFEYEWVEYKCICLLGFYTWVCPEVWVCVWMGWIQVYIFVRILSLSMPGGMGLNMNGLNTSVYIY